MNGGEVLAEGLVRHGVRFLFTLCGGHISPILVAAKHRGLRVVDVRHEATAVFAADAVARLTGVPGVAAVTAGPGCTNTITAVKNAQLAQSPVVLLGGSTATLLRGRGALQDIDQLALFRPHVKWATSVARVRDLAPALDRAFATARSGVPGPVFLECPVDLLYPEELVREWYGGRTGSGAGGGKGGGVGRRLFEWYVGRHVERLFAGAGSPKPASTPAPPEPLLPAFSQVRRAASLLAAAKRPVLVVGSQAVIDAGEAAEVAAAVGALGLPVYLGGMARGLLGRDHPLQLRHQRGKALREADLVLLAGFPCDFRLDYGRAIGRTARLLAVNRDGKEVKKNRRPLLGVVADPGLFLRALAGEQPGGPREEWLATLRRRDAEREAEIAAQAEAPAPPVNPLALCREIESALAEDSVLVVDGGDFVATASYVLRPRGPLTWLDPGPFGTLGVGAGFALGAKLCRPDSEVWLLYGDGAFGYGLAEIDSFVRHSLPVLAVVGNDAGWTQIAREQVEVLGDDVATVLAPSAYHLAVQGLGAGGALLDDPAQTRAVLARAKAAVAAGTPYLLNARLGKTDFRKGSISM